MILHSALGDSVFARNRQLKLLLNISEIQLAGNSKLKIYGTLNCASGKSMKLQNRVFLKNADEALQMGYRPCGHCLPADYKRWKHLDK